MSDISQLPDDVLCNIFAKVSSVERLGTCQLVCHRWKAALSGPSAAWHTVSTDDFKLVSAEDISRFGIWIKTVGASVRQLQGDLLPALESTQAVVSGTGNSRRARNSTKYGCTVAFLSALPSLRKLELDNVTSKALRGIEAATSLTSLSIGQLDDCSEVLGAAYTSGALSRLQELRIVNVRQHDELMGLANPHNVCMLTGLRKLELFDTMTHVPADISRLGRLTELRVANLLWNSQLVIAREVGRCTNLQVLYLHAEYSCAVPAELCSLTQLTKVGLCGALDLSAVEKDAARLSQLQVLYLANMPPAAWENMLIKVQQLPTLRTLSFEGCRLEHLPPSLLLSTNLTALNLHNNLLEYLPHGPYLSSLKMLDLSHNYLGAVPPALKGALQLECLDLSYNSYCLRQSCMELDMDGVHVLSALQNLQYCGLLRYDEADKNEKLEEEHYRPWNNHELACLLQLTQRTARRGLTIDVHRHVTGCDCHACTNVAGRPDPFQRGRCWF